MSTPVDRLATCSPEVVARASDVLVIAHLPTLLVTDQFIFLTQAAGTGRTPCNDRVLLRMISDLCGYRHIMGSPLGAFLCPPGYAGPSGLRAIARESSAVVEAGRLVRRTACDRVHRRDTPYAGSRPTRSLDPVVLVPGFMAGDTTLLLMSRHLRRLGYRTYRSTMHANVGCTQEASYALERRVEAITIRRERKVTIIGHSLGGLLAR